MMKMCKKFLSLCVMAVMVMDMAMAADYTVGGSNGGWDQATDLASWADSITFLEGDNLDFRYSINHDITEVSKPDFDSCNADNPLQPPHTGGATVIPLTSAGTRYFICGTGGHCLGGMKLSITTLAASTPPPTTTPAATSPPPPTTPITTSPPPSTTPAVSSPPPPTPAVASSPPPSTKPAAPSPPPSTTSAAPSPPPSTTPAAPSPPPKPSPDHPKNRAPSPEPKQYSKAVSPSPSASDSSPTGSPPPAPSSAAKFDVMSGLATGLVMMAFLINV